MRFANRVIRCVAILALVAGCATATVEKGLVISGTSLVAIGHEFVDTATAFKTGCDAKTIAAARCHEFGVFERGFKQVFPEAVHAWKLAADTEDAAAISNAEAPILQMALELGVFAVEVGIKTYGGK